MSRSCRQSSTRERISFVSSWRRSPAGGAGAVGGVSTGSGSGACHLTGRRRIHGSGRSVRAKSGAPPKVSQASQPAACSRCTRSAAVALPT